MRKIKAFLIIVLGTLAVGGVSALIVGDFSSVYEMLMLPASAPPKWVFPIVWTALYIIMGIAAYLIYMSDKIEKNAAIKLYLKQLFVNLVWPVIFFGAGWGLVAFVWILILWLLVFVMLFDFYKINKAAAYLIIPYLVWISFATYLNLAVYMLNR